MPISEKALELEQQSIVEFVLGDERLWAGRADAYRRRYRELAPDGIAPAVFDGRGAYGDYYAGQARVVGGF